MAEMIDIFTEQNQKIGTVSKKEYYTYKGNNLPWINCTICYVINDSNKKIILQKRGECQSEAGKIECCSGHVRTGELPFQCAVRELGEELTIPENYAKNIHYLGKIKVDWANLEDSSLRQPRKVSVYAYALKLPDSSIIKKDGREVVALAEATYDETKGFIENNMTRFPYTEKLKPQYDEIFNELKNFMLSKNKVNERIKQ